MSKWRIVLVIGAVFAVTSALGMAGKPAETQKCTITGDISSGLDETVDPAIPAIVEIGINVPAWITLDDDGLPAGLVLEETLLRGADGTTAYLPADYYPGQARMLKRQARFDFDFGPDPCVSPIYGDVPPFWVDGDGLCPYRLIIINGVYDRQEDTVEFDPSATVYLVDYTLGPPCSSVVDPTTEPCIGEETGTSYQVGAGPVSQSPGVHFEFLADGDDGDDPEPEDCFPKGAACSVDEECCSFDCKRSFTCR